MGTERQTRTCIECGMEYSALLPSSRFCSSSCRAAHWRSTQRSETQPRAHETQENGREQPNQSAVDKQKYTETMFAMQIALELHQRDAERWHSAYEEERSKRKILQNEIADLKKEKLRLEQVHAIEAIKNKKPDSMELLLSGLGNLPSPVLEQLMPLIGRLGNFLIPAAPSGGRSHVSTEIQALIESLQGMSEDVRHKVLMTFQKLSQLPEVHLLRTLNEIHKYLESGIRIMTPPRNL